jgi:deoxyribodipyrimidine photolyase-related protein
MTLSVWILGDQLLQSHPALITAIAQAGADQVQVLIIESQHRLHSRPYHQQKQILVLSAMRHYAASLRTQGYTVDYRQAASMTAALHDHIQVYHPTRILTLAASEYHARQRQQSLDLSVPVDILPNQQFLVTQFDPFPNTTKRTIMETFYRAMRRHFNILMEDGQPIGGRWNFDDENRKPLPKKLTPPAALHFPPDTITQQVIQEIHSAGYGVGTGDNFGYAVTHDQARQALQHFIQERLAHFGPYEDAMTSRHPTLYHSVLSPYVNLGLLTPLEMIHAAETAYHRGDAPLNSVEGFIRQVLGWREYMYWQYWRMMPVLAEQNAWNATRPLPSFFWNHDTEMHCLRHTFTTLEHTAYTHHIPRLMLISNFCVLAGIQPQALLDWFLAYYIDAYDWVMQSNTIGMGLNADGGHIATKPYIASASYINRMSDYCGTCRYDHQARTGENACPFNRLYWNFLIQHESQLRANPRFGPAVLGLNRLSDAERLQITQESQRYLDSLAT